MEMPPRHPVLKIYIEKTISVAALEKRRCRIRTLNKKIVNCLIIEKGVNKAWKSYEKAVKSCAKSFSFFGPGVFRVVKS